MRRQQTGGLGLVCWRAALCPLALCWSSLSCSAPGQELRARPSLLEPSRPLEQALSPPEWRYHPRRPAQLARSYELPAGERLFVGDAGERWLIPASAPAAQPASVLAPEPLVGIIMRCLEKEPKKRYRSANELLEELEALRA